MKKAGNKKSRVRGYTKTICPRTMYRQAPANKPVEVSPVARKIIECWVIFSSLFTIVSLVKMVFGL